MFGELWCKEICFWWLDKWPFNEINWRLVIRVSIFIWIYSWWFHLNGANVSDLNSSILIFIVSSSSVFDISNLVLNLLLVIMLLSCLLYDHANEYIFLSSSTIFDELYLIWSDKGYSYFSSFSSNFAFCYVISAVMLFTDSMNLSSNLQNLSSNLENMYVSVVSRSVFVT